MGHHERLSALDAAFYEISTATSSMTVGAVLVFGPGPLVGQHGELDVAHLRDVAIAAVAATPRYRQRITRVPWIGQPTWIDDERFVLDDHLQHVRLPWPGTPRQLDALAATVFSHPLDRDRPLWRWWLVEGLASGGFALIVQAHHCMTDGMGGADLIASALQRTPGAGPAPALIAPPRPRPGRLALIRDEVRHHNERAGRIGAAAWRALTHRRTATRRGHAGRGVVEVLEAGLRPAPHTPINPRRIGRERGFASLALDLAVIEGVRAARGGTLNDVVLAAVTGALRRFLARRGVAVDRLRPLRALIPVSTRRDGDHAVANHVALVLAELPVAEPDPAECLASVRATMDRLKHESGEVQGSVLATDLADAFATTLLTSALRLAVRLPSFNLTVTNVRGPTAPLYLLGSRLESISPKVPLYETQGLGIAMFSYEGHLHVGLSACRRTVPDLDDFAYDLSTALNQLAALPRASATAVSLG